MALLPLPTSLARFPLRQLLRIIAQAFLPLPGIIRSGRKAAGFFQAFVAGLCLMMLTPFAQAQFVHPGALSTQEDLDRMAAKVAAGAQPWKSGWDILVGNEGFYMGGPEAVPTVFVDSPAGGNTYMALARDSHRAYQAALRYHGTKDTRFADQAVRIMNAWAVTHTAWNGNTNIALRQGLYGYAFACAGELMRGYGGWAPADFAAFQQYMRTQFYAGNSGFLRDLIGSCWSHYWANWTLANLASMMAIGVLCDDQAIIDEALNHFHHGVHTAGIENSVFYVHPNGLGQWQESGRDQGHAQMGPQLIGVICEIAWNQGYDLYGYMNNRVLAGVEYISKYNTGHAVPFVAYASCEYARWPSVYRFYQKDVAGPGGVSRPGWDLLYNHYVNRMGIAAPYTEKYAAAARPEGGGSNFGGNSGGFDGLGLTTLTHSRDPITGAVPGNLRPCVQGRQITLSWAGSAHAESYNVKRSTTSGGPYATLATVPAKDLFYVDPGLTAGTTYYYVVSANNPEGESANSAEAPALADAQLSGTVIGSDYSWDHAGATREILFDGAIENFMDVAGTGGGWAGLDLGAGVSAVVTGVRYCPRSTPAGSFANLMIGGKFQASNTADFSSGVVDLFTITTAPADGTLTFQAVNSGLAYRYVRYIQPANNGWNTAAEVQFLGNVSGQSAPSAPVVNLTLVDGLKIDLSWNDIPGATGYRIKRSTTPGGPYLIWGDVNTGFYRRTVFSDVETEMGATYYYVVNAYNQFGESADSAEVSSSTLPTGPRLMAHLKMSGNVADSSGYNFQANPVGSPAYATGYVGSAINLDGQDDFVMLPSRVTTSDDITVAAWVKWDGGAAWQRIFDFGTGTWSYLYLTPSSANGTLRFGIKIGAEQTVEAPSALPVGVWTHVAVTLGGDTATIYVNGSPVASNSSITINPSDFRPGLNYIGKSQWAGDALFKGLIDDFRVYNHALSAGNVAALAAQTPETAPPAAPTGLGATLGDRAIHLDWADNGEPDLASYTVYRSTTSGGGYSVIASGIAASAYTDTDVWNGLTYFYLVTAFDASGGESVRSDWISAVPQGVPAVRYELEGNALDGSGRGNNAIVNGSPTYVAGQIGQAIDFNGSTDYLRIPAGVVHTVDSMTIAAWVNWDGGGAWQRVFDFGDSTSRYMFLTPSSGGGKLRFVIRNGTAERIAETTAPAIGTWVHVAVTLTADTTTLYVNGSPAATTVASVNPTGFDFTPTNNYIGKSQFNDPLFNGRIDDFRIYNYILTASQVNDVKNGGAPGDDTTPPAAPANLTGTANGASVSLDWADNTEPDLSGYTVYRSTTSGGGYVSIATGLGTSAYTDNTAANGVTYYYVVSATDTAANESAQSAEVSATANTLVLHLKFDESGGAVAADSSGQARHATLVNGPAFTAGRVANALNFPATAAQHATLPSGIVSGLTDFTIATWVKVNAFATWQRIFDFGTATNNYMFLTTQYSPTAPNNAKLRFGIRTTAVAEQNVSGASIALSAGVWTHVAVTRSGTTVRLYVNGALAGSGTIALKPSDLGVTTLNYLGKSQWPDPYLNAALDDFRIYGNALSAAELTSLASPLAAPQGLAATPGPLSLDLAWNAVPDATRYTLKYSTTSGGPYSTLSAGLPSTTQLHSDLSYGTIYYYVVSAANSVYESPFSAELAATPESAPLGEAESATPSFSITPASEGNLATATLTTATSVAGHSYQLQTCTDLAAGSWQNVGDPVSGDGSPIVFETPYDPAEPRRFYRILISH
jgi:fibronectin type 3 domain-containing protein